jgi:hypothetical protein
MCRVGQTAIPHLRAEGKKLQLRLLNAISQTLDAVFLRTVITTIEGAVFLQPVPDNPATAVLACRRKSVDGAFEAIEDVLLAILHELEGFVVVISARFASRHIVPYAARRFLVLAAFFADRDRSAAGLRAEALPPK